MFGWSVVLLVMVMLLVWWVNYCLCGYFVYLVVVVWVFVGVYIK